MRKVKRGAKPAKTNRNILRRRKYSKKAKFEKEILSGSKTISLSGSDRITYLYKRSASSSKIVEVVNVSLEIKIKDQWFTIKRYDSVHGFLHKHTRVSVSDDSEIVSTAGVKKKGHHSNWLTWAIKDMKKNFWEYRKAFLERSSIKAHDIINAI